MKKKEGREGRRKGGRKNKREEGMEGEIQKKKCSRTLTYWEKKWIKDTKSYEPLGILHKGILWVAKGINIHSKWCASNHIHAVGPKDPEYRKINTDNYNRDQLTTHIQHSQKENQMLRYRSRATLSQNHLLDHGRLSATLTHCWGVYEMWMMQQPLCWEDGDTKAS